MRGTDRVGIVAAVGSLLSARGANIVSLDQYSDPASGAFFQRTIFSRDSLRAALPGIRAELGKGWRRTSTSTSPCGTCRCRNGWPSSPPGPTTACWTCCSGTGGANSRSASPW
ncbi:ACT domain-containing protein [Streptomyces sp. 900105755]